MTDRSDHLIERAAALLRTANGEQKRAPAAAGPVAPVPAGSGLEPPGGPAMPPRLLVPPLKAPLVPALGLPPVPGQRPPAPSVASSVASAPADARRPSAHPPVGVDVLERAGLIVARSQRTRTAEEYRIVIGRVLRALHEDPEEDAPARGDVAENVVMITSARPGEGKSFTALNLAASVAQNAGERVLLVDVDPKQRGMTDQLGLRENHGFLDFVADPELRLEDLIVPTELPLLSILPLGHRKPPEPNASDAEPGAGSARPVGPALLRLGRGNPKSLVVLDSPPCLSTSDPHTMAPVVGQVVMIVEAERTQRNELEAALDLVRVCPTITMLLNKVKVKSNHTFGAYDYFGSYT